MVDKLLVQQRLAMILQYLEKLKNYRAVPRQDFLGDATIAGAAESYLRRSLEAIFDVGRHILARTGGTDVAAEYKAIARGLGLKKVVDEKLSECLVQMAGYRNRMVHLYHLINDEEIYSILQNDLEDIEEFVRQISRYLGTIDPGQE